MYNRLKFRFMILLHSVVFSNASILMFEFLSFFFPLLIWLFFIDFAAMVGISHLYKDLCIWHSYTFKASPPNKCLTPGKPM